MYVPLDRRSERFMSVPLDRRSERFMSVPLDRRSERFQICFEREDCTSACFKLGDNLLMSDVADRIDAGSEIVKQNYVLRYTMVYYGIPLLRHLPT
jgi:hypothetical protein